MDTNSLLVGFVAGAAVGVLVVLVAPALLSRAGYVRGVLAEQESAPTQLYAVEDEVG